MFYLASDIKFSIFSEFLWKYTLLVYYKLNIFRPLQVSQFDIHALLFWGYARFIPLDKMILYRYWKTAFLKVIDATVSFDFFFVCDGLLL